MAYREPEFLPWDGRRVPLTFVGGYLGAGKTTAINELLAHTDRPIAVIVNDVGQVDVDAALIRRRHGDTIELADGCVCCSAIDGFGAVFDQLRSRPEPPDHVVVELSGVAEPRRMTPWGDSAGFVLDGVVVLVGCDQLLDADLPGWVRTHLDTQIADADLLVLTKTDLFPADRVEAAAGHLAELAPTTPLLRVGRGTIEPGALGRFLALGGRRAERFDDVPPATLFDAHRTSTVPLPTDRADLDRLLADLAGDPLVVRAKGIAGLDGVPTLVQLVGARVELTTLNDAERSPPTDLVVITLADRRPQRL